MTTIQATIPDFLANQAADAAEKEQTTLDNIVAIALSSQLSAWKVRDTVEERAPRGKRSDLEGILATVPNLPPVSGDEKM